MQFIPQKSVFESTKELKMSFNLDSNLYLLFRLVETVLPNKGGCSLKGFWAVIDVFKLKYHKITPRCA